MAHLSISDYQRLAVLIEHIGKIAQTILVKNIDWRYSAELHTELVFITAVAGGWIEEIERGTHGLATGDTAGTVLS